jgi:hypothetical protein
MRSGEWLRTQWIARVAFDLGAKVWEASDANRVLAVLRQLHQDGTVERRYGEERREDEIASVALSFQMPRAEWRLRAERHPMTVGDFVRSWFEGRGVDSRLPLSSKKRREVEGLMRLLFPDPEELVEDIAAARSSETLYSVHPYGDEWLWAEDGVNPKLVRWDFDAIRALTSTHRAGMIRAAEKDGHYFTDMHFVLRQNPPARSGLISTDIAALVTADDEIFARDDPGFLDAWLAIVKDDGDPL